MADENGPELIDYRRAAAVIKFAAPGAIDTEGINAIFDELSDDHRTGQALVAMAAIAHDRAPHLRTPEGLHALQTVIERLRLQELGEDTHE